MRGGIGTNSFQKPAVCVQKASRWPGDITKKPRDLYQNQEII
jgi:hypothetical protein